MYILLSCLVPFLIGGLWVSVNAQTSTAESVQLCIAGVEEEHESNAKSLLQLTQGHDAHVRRHASELQRRKGFTVYNGLKQTAERAITFVTVYDPYFEMNLGTSALWTDRENHPHQWVLIDNNHNYGISQMYAEVQASAENDLMVFLHPDIILPDDFYENFMHKLWIIQEYDSNWAVLGVVGVPIGEFLSKSSITDFAQNYTTGSDFLAVQGVDECLMVLRKDSPMFDAQLPGFDLYGLDVVLSARKAGRQAYLLNVPVFHKIKGIDGTEVAQESFDEKVDSPDYVQRVDQTAKYFQAKWCDSGLLPVMGPSFRVECGAWCKVIHMLNRTHHNETCVDPTGEYQNFHQ